METRQFGKTDMQVSVLGFGGAEIGFEQQTVQEVTRLLNAALDAGLNVIDTAECYLASEELIGQAVSRRRKDFCLFTKCGHPEKPGVGDWRPESLARSIERSLKRLKANHVDLIQLHSCDEADLRKGDVMSALQRARDKGQTRYIGYSGDSSALRYAVECGAFDSVQTSVNIADQEAIDILPLARERRMGVIAKRPLANVAWRYATTPANTYHRPYWERLRKLDYDFLNRGTEEAVSIALRFTLSVPGVDTAIVGTKNPDRWSANARLLEAGQLPAAQFDAIRAIWRPVAQPDWIGQT